MSHAIGRMGQCEYLGRVDQQVKVRGFRIELGEIEAALLRQQGVLEAVVAAHQEGPGNTRLVAYVVLQEAGLCTPSSLRAFIQQRLPEYMVPAIIMIVDSLPQTANGKVDRKALPAPVIARDDLGSPYMPPQNLQEEKLAQIWSSVLGVKDVGVHDNFFELGGDSILAMQVSARARANGLQVIARQLFENPTIARLLEVASTTQPIPVDQGPVTGAVAATPIQRWFFEQNWRDPQHYNQAVLLELQIPGSAETWRVFVDQIQTHHDMLRLRVAPEHQLYLAGPGAAVPLHWHDLSELPLADALATLEAVAGEIQAGLDLANGPVFQVAVFHLGHGQRDRLLFVAHHLLIDGLSWRILLEDIQTLYSQLRHNEPLQLVAQNNILSGVVRTPGRLYIRQNVLTDPDFWLRQGAG